MQHLINELAQPNTLRTDWSVEEVGRLFREPLSDLIYSAQTWHRKYFDANRLQLSTLLNIKTGGCPEDCAYCPQSAHFKIGVTATKLLALAKVREAAVAAKAAGATRFCMGAAWRNPNAKDLEAVATMVAEVKALGMESCATLGMLTDKQAHRLKEAGLDYYNHNLDTSPDYYEKIISTRTYSDRLATLRKVRDAGIRICCGGIIGMGEDLADRCGLLVQLANMDPHPESVPINVLVRVAGTPLASAEDIDPLDVVRTVAVARIMMPSSYLRLSAGRTEMSDELQALCFLAGANSVFYGERLLTTDNPDTVRDRQLFERLGLSLEA